MIQAQLTLPDGRTPGRFRRGTIAIDVAIAQGCRIYPHPLNRLPDGYDRYLLKLDSDDRPRMDIDADMGPVEPVKAKRGRPKKAKP